ncbi:MAG: oligopeptide:H+ symporter [Isosphaeraceae bacterium]|nr:oligopeptide:H+ symporter [Isosphaeraceae bacterium]
MNPPNTSESTTGAPRSAESGFLGHPRGLFTLFFTEMWERFSFYLMIALLTLYMTDYLGFANARASDIATWYIALVYFTPFLGGLIADKITGPSTAILIGGVLMMAGHITLAFDSKASSDHIFLFAALGLLIAGNGLFKPNVSSIVGDLYASDDPRRDQGYTIFYMGINVGATLAPLAANYIRKNGVGIVNDLFGTSLPAEAGWHLAFGSAGFGMLLSLLIFVLNKGKFSAKAGNARAAETLALTSAPLTASDRGIAFAQTFNMVAVGIALAWLLLGPLVPWPESIAAVGLWPTDVVHFGIIWLAIETITVAMFLAVGDRVAADAARLKAVFVVVAIFWMAFHQNSVTLTFFARDNTQSDWDPETFQSVNPFLILVLSPVMVWLWSSLARARREPSTTTKMILGMIVTGLAYVVMMAAGFAGADTGKVGPGWLVGCYALLTVAELWISPIGLSLTSKLAPPRYRGLWMGFWFLATAVGNKLVHVTGQFWGKYPPSKLFLILVITSFAAALSLVVILRILRLFERKTPMNNSGIAAVLLALVVWGGLDSTASAAGRPMKVDDLLGVKSVSDPQVSPDGKLVVYVVSEYDPAAGKSNADLWIVQVEGGEPRRLTATPGPDTHPRWRPDGREIAFTSSRGGSSQVWLIPPDGGEARPLTKLPIDVSGPIWSPKGDKLVVAAEVYPGTTPEETAARDKARAASKSKVRVYDSLMIRHWDRWDDGKRSHLLVIDATTGAAIDVTPELRVNTPPAPFGGSSDYAFSPDGLEVVFTAEPVENMAWSTNTDLWSVPSSGGKLRNLTSGNPAADAQPAFSPDGAFLAFVSQDTPGYESDQWVLTVKSRETSQFVELTRTLDRPVLGFSWGPPSKVDAGTLYELIAVVDHEGTEPLVRIGFIEDEAGRLLVAAPEILTKGGVSTAATSTGKNLIHLHANSVSPAEIHRTSSDGSKSVALTKHNAAKFAELDLHRAEEFRFKGADGDEVAGWLIKPPGFDPKKKYPVLFLIHGGPQGAWHDEWSARWNYAMFTSPGYVGVAINPRGSTGYGQKFTLQISKDWTGRVYTDLMLGLDHALKTYSFLDESRMAAAGGSYGGFMVNWILGHTDRFKALISHAGVFDLTSKYGTTEELWFPEFEFGGPPWDAPDLYKSQTPSAFVKNFKTPTLVIHGALDFRVPEAQGIGLFTALQRRGVPSRLVLFPDEGHWILQPANRIEWWKAMHGWLAEHLGKP